MAEFWATTGWWLGAAILICFHLVGIAITALGFPGTFLQLVATAVFAWATDGSVFGWKTFVFFCVLIMLSEIFEFWSGKRGAEKRGGSPKAAWGALLGGFVGSLIGLPVPLPLVGSLIGAMIGTFAGAFVGELLHRRGLVRQSRNQPKTQREQADNSEATERIKPSSPTQIAWASVVARAFALAFKIAVGLVMLIMTLGLLIAG